MGFSAHHIRVAVIGASGYSGAEVLRLLAGREDVRLCAAVARTAAGGRVDALYPDLTGILDTEFMAADPDRLPEVDVAFVALPSGEGMLTVPALFHRAERIIDLGGDFRLRDAAHYRHYYGRDHAAEGLLSDAVYGLPELYRERIAGARLVANPGCYPTSAILALLPALRHGVIGPEGISIVSMSGVSGAGRSAQVEMSFAEVNENIRAYRVGTHQHVPEIEDVLTAAGGSAVTVSFIPHLVPLTRGIYTTVQARLTRDVTTEDLLALYADEYRKEPFVRIRREPPEIRAVLRTNFCDIAPVADERTGRLIVMSVIDNLVKGAAGQAIQNMNIMFGLPETAGLRPG